MHIAFNKIFFGLAILGLTLSAHADCPSTTDRFIAHDDQVTDRQTGLVWARCSIGQNWNGENCQGDATTLTLKQAEDLTKKSDGWRLPTLKELMGIVDSGCSYPAINEEIFPDTPKNWAWTSSDFPWSYQSSVWVVLLWSGDADGFYRGYDHLIARLVRDKP